MSADNLDYEIHEKTGEWLYVETIYDEIPLIDFFDEEVAPDVYWAEGWVTGHYEASRSGAADYNDVTYKTFPTRYRVADFKLRRNHRRVLKMNDDLRCVVRPFRCTPAKDELYQRHWYARFKRVVGPLSKTYDKIYYRNPPLRELAVFHPTHGLIAFSMIEIGEYSTYGVRTVWAPDELKRSLGTYVLLKSVEYTRSLGYEHYYVGPALLADPSFSYKLRFPACELYDWEANEWVRRETERGEELLHQPLPRRRWDPETEDWAE